MKQLLTLFKALADKNRVRIFAALMHNDELCACQITEMLGVAGATASRHLAQLQSAGLITSRKEGRWNFFRLAVDLPADFQLEWLKLNLENSAEVVADAKTLSSILAENPEDICRRQRGGQ